MSEYWKSNPKKYCDFCKVWLQDNKATIQTHEQGNKHKENVQARLKEIKKHTIEKRAEDKKYNSTMAAIEMAAMKSMEKDLENDPSLKKRYGLPTTSFASTPAAESKPEPPTKKKIEVTKEKRKIEDDKTKPVAKMGAWEPIQKKTKTEEDTESKPVDLQLPVPDKPKFVPISNSFKTIELDDQVTTKKTIEEKVVTLNSKPVKCGANGGVISFKKRSNTNQSTRQRTDD